MGINNLKFSNPELLLNYLNIKDVPDVFDIARSFDFKIVPYSSSVFPQFYSAIKNIKGLIDSKIGENSCDNLIAINSLLCFTSQKFICAYLFSCYQLYGDKEYHNVLFDESIYDKDAYQYAVDLLVPDFIFRKELEQINKNYDSFCDKYEVSTCVLQEKIKKFKI